MAYERPLPDTYAGLDAWANKHSSHRAQIFRYSGIDHKTQEGILAHAPERARAAATVFRVARTRTANIRPGPMPDEQADQWLAALKVLNRDNMVLSGDSGLGPDHPDRRALENAQERSLGRVAEKRKVAEAPAVSAAPTLSREELAGTHVILRLQQTKPPKERPDYLNEVGVLMKRDSRGYVRPLLDDSERLVTVDPGQKSHTSGDTYVARKSDFDRWFKEHAEQRAYMLEVNAALKRAGIGPGSGALTQLADTGPGGVRTYMFAVDGKTDLRGLQALTASDGSSCAIGKAERLGDSSWSIALTGSKADQTGLDSYIKKNERMLTERLGTSPSDAHAGGHADTYRAAAGALMRDPDLRDGGKGPSEATARKLWVATERMGTTQAVIDGPDKSFGASFGKSVEGNRAALSATALRPQQVLALAPSSIT